VSNFVPPTLVIKLSCQPLSKTRHKKSATKKT
jgi:hypothetical protein